MGWTKTAAAAITLATVLTTTDAVSAGPLARPVAYEVTAAELHVRAGPGTQHAVLGRVRQGQVYAVHELSGQWARLQLGGTPGRATWSSLTSLRATAHPIRWVLPDELNVRSGPDPRFRVLGTLGRGTPLAVVDGGNGWAQIYYEGVQAWVHAAWLGTAPPGGAPAAPATPARPTSSAGFVQLAAAGAGFESYTTASRRWGRPALVHGLERAGRRWALLRRDRIGVGDLSLERGGPFPPHAGHQRGTEVDVSPVRSDGRELATAVGASTYSHAWTRRLIDLLRSEVPTDVVLFDDRAIPGVAPWPGHSDHLHLRIR